MNEQLSQIRQLCMSFIDSVDQTQLKLFDPIKFIIIIVEALITAIDKLFEDQNV